MIQTLRVSFCLTYRDKMGVIEWQEFVVGAWWTLVNVRQNSYYFTIILDNVFPLGTLYNVYISILTKNNRTNSNIIWILRVITAEDMTGNTILGRHTLF